MRCVCVVTAKRPTGMCVCTVAASQGVVVAKTQYTALHEPGAEVENGHCAEQDPDVRADLTGLIAENRVRIGKVREQPLGGFHKRDKPPARGRLWIE